MTAGDFSFDTIFRLSPSGESESDKEILFPIISIILWIIFLIIIPILFINMLVRSIHIMGQLVGINMGHKWVLTGLTCSLCRSLITYLEHILGWRYLYNVHVAGVFHPTHRLVLQWVIPVRSRKELISQSLLFRCVLTCTCTWCCSCSWHVFSGGSRILKRGVPVCAVWANIGHIGCLLGGSGACPPQENFGFLTFWDRFWCILGVKLRKLDDLLLNLIVVFEARRIKGVTPLRAAEAGK